MNETNNGVVVDVVTVDAPVVDVASMAVASKPASWDHGAVAKVYPWFGTLPAPMQEAARDQWMEAAVEDATLLPTDGMDDRDQWEKALEAWVKCRDTVVSEAELEADEQDYAATMKQAVRIANGIAGDKQVLAVLCHHALRIYLAPNSARKVPYKRRDVMGEMMVDLRDSMDSVTELAEYVRYGACSAVLFGATKATPIVGRDGIVRAKLGNGVKAMPWTIITALSPLVVKSGSDTEEQWAVLPHVADEVRTLVESVKADAKMPRSTISAEVERLRLANGKAEVSRNPHNKAAAAEVAKLEAKLADKAEADVEETAVETVAVETVAVPTPETPVSVVEALQANGEDAERTDAECVAYDMHEFLSEAPDKAAAWVAFLELCKDDDTLDADIKSDCIAMLLRRSNRAAK